MTQLPLDWQDWLDNLKFKLKESEMIDMPKEVMDKVSSIADGVEIKKLNVEVEKDGKTYTLNVDDGAVSADIKPD